MRINVLITLSVIMNEGTREERRGRLAPECCTDGPISRVFRTAEGTWTGSPGSLDFHRRTSA